MQKRGGVSWGLGTVICGLYSKNGTVSLIGGRPPVREVLSSILGDFTSLFRLFFFLCSVNVP